MSRRRDSIVNRTHLANEKQTKRGAVKFALNDQWQKPFLHLIVKTGESKEEYAVGKALLNLSVEPVMSSGEQIKLLKMSYNPNGGDSLKLLQSPGKMDWVLTYYELLIRPKQWRRLFEIWIHWHSHFFDCGGDFH